jgi:hypothetical protein
LTALSNLSTSLHSWNDPNHQASADLWLIPSYKLGSKFRLSTTLVLEREITGEQQTQISRSDLGLGWAGSELNPFLKLTVGSALKLPLVTNARARDSLITAVKVAPRLNLSLERLGLPSLSAFYENSGTLAFHEYETATSGRPNTRISWGQTLSGSWAPGEKFSATSTFAWVNAWTYGGTRTTSYQLDQQVSWQFTPVIGASVGIGNTGSPLKANGTDSAVSLIDPESSQAYCTLSLTL